MKHFIQTFLLAICICMVAAKAFAYDIAVKNSNGITIYYDWINNKTELSVSSSNKSYSGDIVIPEAVVYDKVTYSVSAIGNLAFFDCSYLTSITIPNSVRSIGEKAFKNCIRLTSITKHISLILAEH